MSDLTLRPSPRSLARATGLLTLLVACKDAPPPAVVAEFDTGPLVPVTTDVRVVEDTAPAWGGTSQWTVGETPTLDLDDPATPFTGLAPVLRLSDGRIVVADGSQQNIRYFDRSGALLRTVGGRNADEGEFHGLGWIGRARGDTVVAYDFVARRFVLYDGKGKFARIAKLRPADDQAFAEPLASFPDGSVLFRVGAPRTPFVGAPGTVVLDSSAYVRFALDGTPQANLGVFPQGQTFGVQVRPGSAPAPFPVPFGTWTAAAVRGDSMLIGTAASFEIASIGPDGTPVGLLRAAIPRAVITPEEASAYTAAALTRLRTGALSMQTPLDSSFIRAIERAPFPARKPAFGQLVVDRTGALWVSEPVTPPAEPTSWTVFGADGAWLGSVATPAGLRIDEIGADYVLGVWRQAHGGERVRSYPLSRGAGS